MGCWISVQGICQYKKNISLFHTDRDNEFKNKLIEDVLKTFAIKRSLIMKGCPYDNAVAEPTFKIIKTEFFRNYHFESLEALNMELTDYVNWFNKKNPFDIRLFQPVRV